MKYLVVIPEIAYITRLDGKGAIDSWDAPNKKFFQPQKSQEFTEETETPEIFRHVKVVDKLVPAV